MPKLYNIEPWFTATYEKQMEQVIEAIRANFDESKVRTDYMYLQRLNNGHEWQRSSFRMLISGDPFVWDGPSSNVGYNIIRTVNRYLFQRVLPSYMVASIEVFDKGSSMAEISDMPLLLAERLTPLSDIRWPEDHCHWEVFNGYSDLQMRTIRSVLDLIQMRREEEGAVATRALDLYWSRFPSLAESQ